MNKKDEEIIRLYNDGWTRNQISKILHIGHNYVQKIIQLASKQNHLLYLAEKIRRNRARARELQRILGLSYWSAYKRVGERSFEGLYARYNPHRIDGFIKGTDDEL